MHHNGKHRIENKLVMEAPAEALARWDQSIKAAADDAADDNGNNNMINVYSEIGQYYYGGMTAKVVSAVLRNAKGAPVTVNINSPGGDVFEGITIYNMLSEYDGEVNVKVLGLAASAASLIALAGDNVEIAESGFMMIHNAWGCVCGNKGDLKEAMAYLQKVDSAMAGIYAAATGMDAKEIAKMMDQETWLSGAEALDMGFAHGMLGADDISVDHETAKGYNAVLRELDNTLARGNMPRSRRREIIKQITNKDENGMPGAAENETMLCAGLDESLKGLLNTIEKAVTQ